MSYLSQMTDDDIQYICDVIPYEEIREYFQHNPKQFCKIHPGFRVSSVKRNNASKILYSARNSLFVTSFIEKHISIWLAQIEARLSTCLEDGDSSEMAYVHTLPKSFFSENYALYFKLAGKEKSEDYIALLKAFVKAMDDVDETSESNPIMSTSTEGNIDDRIESASEAEQMIEMLTEMLTEKEQECAELTAEVQQTRALRIALSSERSLSQLLVDDNDELSHLIEFKEKELEKILQDKALLESRLADATQAQYDLEIRFSTIVQEKLAIESAAQEAEAQVQAYNTFIEHSTVSRMRPEKLDEFKEYLGYNLENAGVSQLEDYFDLLVEHLSSVLFQGVPILVNSAVGNNIARCVANTLIGTINVETLTYTTQVSAGEIKYFLNNSGRIVLLDGFIGNFSEMQLLPIISPYRSKIIFLTYMYEKTLRYIPIDFLVYCYYFNANRIGALLNTVEITEDPSIFQENEGVEETTVEENRFQRIGNEILRECGFTNKLVEHTCAQITNEDELCQLLAYSFLPYCADVLGICPYNLSRRLQRYAGQAGKSQYKSLLLRWFDSE